MTDRVLSLVERGWRGARECSLALGGNGVAVTHLIKGSLPPPVRAMIRPAARISIIDVPRRVFRVWLWAMVLRHTLTRGAHWVLLDNERTLREVGWWCRRFRLIPVFVRETAEGYTLEVSGRPASFDEIFGNPRGVAQSSPCRVP